MDTPRWSTVLTWTLLLVAGGIATVVTLLVWAWKGGDDTALPGVLLLVELGGLLALVTVGRPLVRSLARLLWLTIPGRALMLVGLLPLMVGLLSPGHSTTAPGPGKKVAVVGAGAAGMHAAWMLMRTGADVTVYEAAPYVGGHALSYPFEGDDGTVIHLDTGFMFGAPTSYKELKALLKWYGIGRTHTALNMSGKVFDKTWSTGMADIDPEVLRFHQLADGGVHDESLNLVPFWAWLDWHGFDEDFRRDYIMPLLSVIFVTDKGLYEISTRFVLNLVAGPNRWLDFRGDAAAWVVEGGSSSYYDKLIVEMGHRIRTLTPVTAVRRQKDGTVRVTSRGPSGMQEEVYDAVIFGVHADVARTLLVDRSWFEDFVLGQIRYDSSEVVIHTDTSMFFDGDMRRNYTYVQDESTDGGRGFELHSLGAHSQRGGVAIHPEPVITLSPDRDYEDTRFRRGWRHHRTDLWHLAMVLKLLPTMQGAGNVWYGGDWVTFVGHGPAMITGLYAACQVGGREPTPGLSTEPCFDVDLVDPVPAFGVERETVRICGERGLFERIAEKGCSGKVGP